MDLSGPLAVLVPAWHEADVIGVMIAHTLRAWPQPGLHTTWDAIATIPIRLPLP